MSLWEVQTILPAVHRYYQAKSDVKDQILECVTKLENDDVKRLLVPVLQRKLTE